MRHPATKSERARIAALKKRTNDLKKKQEEERTGRIWRKLSRETIQERETSDEVREGLRQGNNVYSVEE